MGILDHRAEHAADFTFSGEELHGFDCGEIAISACNRKPVLYFMILGVSIAQFADKMCFVATFAPSLGNIRPDGSRCASDLIRE